MAEKVNYHKTPEFREIARARIQKLNLRQDIKDKNTERLIQLNTDPAFRESKSVRLKQLWENMDFREKNTELSRARMKALHASGSLKGKVGRKKLDIPDDFRKAYRKLAQIIGPQAALKEIQSTVKRRAERSSVLHPPLLSS